MAERGVDVDHSTIARSVVHYAPMLNELIRQDMRAPNRSWRVDETYIRVAGRWTYSYRAIDSAGNTIEFLLSPNRDLIAAKGFLQLALAAANVHPRVINVDGHVFPMASIKHTDSDKRFRRILSASSLAGDRVKNSAGEDLGKVTELMIDIPSGRVAYAVLPFGVLRVGNELFAVPWNALAVDEDEKQFLLNVDRVKLENAPGFDKDNWPDMAGQT